jgi:hypothetical protein
MFLKAFRKPHPLHVFGMNRTRVPIQRPGLLIAAAMIMGGCGDAPTIPDAIQRLAGGEEWVAMSAPHDLPRLDTWIAYMSRATEEERSVYAEVRRLESLSREAQRSGRIGTAAELTREAERIAVLSLSRPPDARVMQRSLFALDFWSDRVSGSVEVEQFPQLQETLHAVLAARATATALLADGDTTAAVLAIASAAERIREHTPEAVAVRVLSLVEERIDLQALRPAAAERALHLLANARQELISGDPRRALNRALYALQIVEGSELRTVTTGPDSTCFGPLC